MALVALDGKLYALGGNGPSNAVEVYDPATNAWTPKAPMPTARVYLAAAAAGGKIYAIGGSPDCCGDSRTAVVEVYDPFTDSWTSAAPLPVARQGSAAVGLNNGKVLAFGGLVPGMEEQGDAFEYDPAQRSLRTRYHQPSFHTHHPCQVTPPFFVHFFFLIRVLIGTPWQRTLPSLVPTFFRDPGQISWTSLRARTQ